MVKIVLGLLLFWLTPALGNQQPTGDLAKYELGFAVGGIYLPSYPGSDEYTSFVIPVPYVIYRGDILKADREGGFRGVFYERGNFEVDLGFGGGFPTDPEANEARDGMDELDWTIEFGPRAKWMLEKDEDTRLILKVPVRAVYSVDFPDTKHQGWVFNPELSWREKIPWGSEWRLFSSLGFSIASKKLAEYFYTVKPSEALPDRPAYEAQSGYWATNVAVLIGKRFPKKGINVVGGASWNIYEGNDNVDSPLLRDRYTVSYFLGFAMKLWESEERGYGNDETFR